MKNNVEYELIFDENMEIEIDREKQTIRVLNFTYQLNRVFKPCVDTFKEFKHFLEELDYRGNIQKFEREFSY